MKGTYTKTLQEVMEKLEAIEKELQSWKGMIKAIEGNIGILIGRDEKEYYHLNSHTKPIDSTSNWCFVCNQPKKDCICFKPRA